MADIEGLERRVSALEVAQNDTTQTLRWVVSKLGQMSAVQDQHTLRLERLEEDMREVKTDLQEVKTDLQGVKTDLQGVKTDLQGLRNDLPGIVSDAMRDVLSGNRNA